MKDIKFDLSQTVRQVETLAQAMNTVLQATEQALGRIGQFSNTIESTVQRVSTGTRSIGTASGQPGGPADYMTTTGAQFDYQRQKAERESYQRSKDIMDAVNAGAYNVDSRGFIRGGVERGKYGVKVPNYGTMDEHRGIVEQYEANDSAMRRDLADQVRQSTSIASGSSRGSAYQPSLNLSGVGIREADIASTYKDQQGLIKSMTSIEDAIRGLKSSEDKSDRVLADSMDRVSKQFLDASARFEKAIGDFEKASHLNPNDPVYQARLAARNNAAGETRGLADQINEMKKGMGGGGDGVPPSLMSNLGKFGGSALGAVGTATLLGYSLYQNVDRAYLGATTGALGQEFGLGAQSAALGMEARTLTDARNMMRYYGDQILPGMNHQFLGGSGLDEAKFLTDFDESHRLNIAKRQHNMSWIQKGMQFGAGAAGAVAGGAIGAAIGGPVGLIAGAATGSAAAYGAISSWHAEELNNEHARFSGAADDRLFVNTPFADAQAGGLQRLNHASAANKSLANARALRDQELQMREPEVRALQQLLEIEKAERSAVGSVGSLALGRGDILSLYDGSGPTPFETHELSYGEFVGRSSALANATNMSNSYSRRGMMGMVDRLSHLGYAGVGDYGALSGNMASMAAAGGSPEQILSRLESVMSDAISAGFDKSRTGQQFIQSATSLAHSSGVRNIDAVSAILGSTAVNASLNPFSGRADEIGLRRAERAISSVNQVTGQRGGAFGHLKLMGAMGAGSSFEDAIIYNDMDLTKMIAGMEDISGANGNVQNLQNETIKGLVMSKAGKLTSQGMSRDEAYQRAFSETTAEMQGAISGVTTPFTAGGLGVSMRETLASIGEEFRGTGGSGRAGFGANTKDRIQGLQTTWGHQLKAAYGIDDAAANMLLFNMIDDIDPEMGKAWRQQITSSASLKDRSEQGFAAARDAAEQGRINYFDNVIRNMRTHGMDSMVSFDSYRNLLESNESGAVFYKNGRRHQFSKKDLETAFSDSDSKQRQSAREGLANLMGTSADSLDFSGGLEGFSQRYGRSDTQLGNLELVRSMRENVDASLRPQNVVITNVVEVAQAITGSTSEQIKKNLSAAVESSSVKPSTASFTMK